jgi:hypothetical protein
MAQAGVGQAHVSGGSSLSSPWFMAIRSAYSSLTLSLRDGRWERMDPR